MSKVKKSDVVNRTGGVLTADGRTLYGLDAETYEKMQSKMDPQFQANVASWIESTTGEKLERPDDLYLSLRSGIVLCKLVNAIRPGLIKKYSTGKGLHALVELENINYFLKACWSLGVPSSDLFSAHDLHSNKSMPSVLQTIASLSRIAKSHGFKGEPMKGDGGGMVNSDSSSSLGPVRHWEISSKMGTVSSQDLVDDSDEDPQQTILDLKRQLEHSQFEVKQLEREVHILGEKNEALLTKLRDRNVGESSISKASSTSRTASNNTAAMTVFAELQKELESIRASSKETIKDLDQQCSALEAQVRLLKEENLMLQSKASSSTTNTMSPSSSSTNLATSAADSSVISKQKATISTLETQLKSAQTQNSGLESQITGFKSQVSDLRTQVSTLTSTINTLQSEIETLKSEQRDSEEKAKESLKAQIKLTEAAKTELSAQVTTLKSDNQALKSEIRGLKNQALRDRDTHADELATLQGKHEDALSALEQETKTKYAASEAEVRRLQRLVESLQREQLKLVAVTAASSSRGKKEEEEKKKKAEAETSSSSMETDQARVDAEHALEDERTKTAQLSDQVKTLQSKVDSLVSERDKLRKDNTSSLQETRQLEEARQKLQAELEDLKSKFADSKTKWEAEMADLEEDHQIIERRYQAAVIEVRTLKTEARKREDTARSEKQTFEDKESELRQTIASQQTRISGYQETITTLQEEKESLQRLGDSLKVQLSQAKSSSTETVAVDKQQAALQDKLTKAEQFAETLKRHIKSKDTQIETLEKRFATESDAIRRREQAETAQVRTELTLLKATHAALEQVHAATLAELQKSKEYSELLEQRTKAASPSSTSAVAAASALSSPQTLGSSIKSITLNSSSGSTPGDSTSPRTPKRTIARNLSLQPLDPSLLEIKKRIEEEGQTSVAKPGKAGGSSGVPSLKVSSSSISTGKLPMSMFYEKTIDESLLVFCKTSIEKIVFGTGVVVYDDMPQLGKLFKYDTGRRIFAFLLQFHVTKDTMLSDEAFEVLTYLLNTCLTEMLLSESQDYTTLSILCDISKLLCRPTKGHPEFIKSMIRGHDVFLNAEYWEQRFLTNFAKSYKSKFEKKVSTPKGKSKSVETTSSDNATPPTSTMFTTSKQKDWAKDQIIDYMLDMLWWGMPDSKLQSFLNIILPYVYDMTQPIQTEIINKVIKQHKANEEEQARQYKKMHPNTITKRLKD